MKTLVIIGAGATRAEAEASKATADQIPPLDTDFFLLAERHGLKTHLDTVQAFMQSNFSFDISSDPRPRMEEAFGLVYTTTTSAPAPPRAIEAFESLCRIYVRVIANSTNWLEPALTGPLCRLLEWCAKDGPLSVLTFNQDIVTEKALTTLTAANPGIRWFPKDGYGLVFSMLTTPTGSPPHFKNVFPIGGPTDATTVPVHKPHGSLNWYVRTTKANRVPSRMSRDKRIFCTRRRRIDTTMTSTFQTASGLGRKKFYTWPVIVPPIFEKSTFLGGALASVWNTAWDELVSAERIVVYGYSFPDADQQSRSLFLRAASQRTTRPLLYSVNPSFTSAERAHSLFRPTLHTVATTVDALVTGVP
jgi:hypothetical protein